MKQHYTFSKRSFLTFLFSIFTSLALLGQTVSTLTGGFSASGGVRTDSDGNIFVADFGPNFNVAGTQVYRITPEGDVSIYSQSVLGATGGAFNSQGNLFWSSFAGNRVDRINPDGSTTLFAGISGPVAIAIDPEDNLFVASCNTNSVIRITPAGVQSTFVTSNNFSCANGMTFDNEGNLYVTNFNDSRVHKVTPGGTVSLFANVPGNNAVNIAFTRENFYVTSRAAHQIYRITKAGEVSLFAGSGTRGNNDGPALQASFSLPNGISAGPEGDKLYVNDAVPLAGSNFHPSILRVITIPNVGIGGPNGLMPEGFSLKQNFPNPFNPTTTIEYEIPESGNVTLKIFNSTGEEIRTLIRQKQAPGSHSITWDGKNRNSQPVSSGVYLYMLKFGDFFQTQKMALVR